MERVGNHKCADLLALYLSTFEGRLAQYERRHSYGEGTLHPICQAPPKTRLPPFSQAFISVPTFFPCPNYNHTYNHHHNNTSCTLATDATLYLSLTLHWKISTIHSNPAEAMSPSIITIDTSPDIDFSGNPALTNGPASTTTTSGRTLLLAPPSVASSGDLTAIIPSYDRATTDLHMLDRLSAGLVALPAETYDLVLLLTSADGSRHAEAADLLTRDVFGTLVPAMRAGGKLVTQDGRFGDKELREAVLAGLVEKDGAFEKVDEEEVVIPLRFGKKKTVAPTTTTDNALNGNGSVFALNAQPVTAPPVKALPIGVGFDFGDDLDDDDELIDEDDLMTEEDLNRPIQVRKCNHPQNVQKFKPIDILVLTFDGYQPPSVPLSLARSAVPARTAPVVLPNAWRPRTMPAAPRLTLP